MVIGQYKKSMGYLILNDTEWTLKFTELLKVEADRHIINCGIENTQYMSLAKNLDHRRPNLRMSYQVLRVFNGFYKQIYSQPKLF
jgi:hypothetical protein